ncbi:MULTISPECIES: D-alanyl-D-alanine carboxypeptidase [unclassified Streptomyces]|uniref:D-alanyl-D-alanine carboxypeptidase n=1 Tax=unclassified Streptomyces TaxID=2593676 RepID=UPI002DDC33BF|nr:D-alanyl-D-alanine carboxypeptidase [Streptomyces sp. NBC_01788]WSB27287.1 D-alanyl-D-alanine carboxypeptidase [Streptomyces sp. NBC_01788]
MAGESPDRSKQRESSARTTSGSADSVPESRNEAGDPRIALTGESDEAGASGASGGSEGRGGVDTATRVLSVRDVKTKSETDDDADDTGDADDTEGAAESEEEASEAAADGDETDGAGDTRLRAAAAARVDSDADGKDAEAASGDDTEEAEASEAKKDADDSDDADDPEPAKAGAAPESDAEEPEGAARGKDEAEPQDADEAAADASDAEDADASSDDDDERAEADTEAEAGTASEAPERAKAVAEPEEDAEAPEDGAGERAEDDAPEAGDDDRDGDEGDGKPSGDGKRAEDDKAPEGDAGPGEKPPVDQPTTMLKLGGAAKPQVDQPTTMLKLGGAKKQAPEAEAERTSKFVALKPHDAPPARKPQLPKSPTPAQPPTSAPKPAPADPRVAVPQLGPERTTQQPLPPKPPLDLLAELTNTPPPPETPLRTTVRRVKIWTPLVLLLVIVFAVVQSVRTLPETSLALTAEDTYTFDGDPVKLPWPDEGQGWMDVDGVGTMDHFGEQKPVPIGSVAKTMTAYIILREHPLKVDEEGPKIEVDPTAEKEAGYNKDGESTLDNVKAGSFLTEKQALSAVMIPSANNIARLLARWDAGSEAEFVKKMNATAKELGMSNTTYTDPSGLNKTTVSTAEDQVKLGNAAMRIPAMVAITSAASWTDPTGKYWTNFNQLPYTIGAIGIKTGSTTAAGGNLLFAARKEVGGRTVTIVGAILAQYKAQSILDLVNSVSKTALLAAQKVPTSAKILKKGDVVGYVDDQLGGHTPVVVTKDVTAVGWGGLRLKLSLTTKDALPHTAKAGTEVGMLTVGEGAESAVQVPVALQDDLAEPGFPAKLTRVG